ncbi:hypothetical protein EOD40_03425 [Flavobacterium sufflavum]|uniref:Bacteriophage abortive infection AbiH n=1 Tax=Flavobacterium sufflavum TaxID=1921138 RepID=A0A3S2U4S6_9FLAO|nr:AbiH family protein [Flavobacterium sufflavum]RVT78300.1 hypothetical protein EOD40_03425 [Flavobacterium sufflavum]
MNRLVIIGNGFDLAHGLPTSYGHFIDDFWKNFKDKCKSDEYKELVHTNDSYDGYYNGYKPIKNFSDFKSNLIEYCKDYSYKYAENKLIAFTSSTTERDTIFDFKSDFFRQICDKETINNWVDIETEYYRNLINIAKSTPVKGVDKSNLVEQLNSEFELIKKLLYNYLKQEICDKYEFKIDDSNEIINYFKDEIDDINNSSFQSYSTLFLSFNYTPTARVYNDYLKSKLYSSNVNYIHGEIGNGDNPDIIFGYGDDKDENYKMIKNFNDNLFLENIKSFEYKNNDNFENLLDFLSQSKYKVYLVGHSCGLSDKYLLNQILENDNCDSIVTLYRNYEDGTDDFRNKPRDISRHFDNDRLATTRIVNKKKSRDIPQHIRFELKDDNFEKI